MRVFYVVAAAVSARSFLISHFYTLKNRGHDVFLICSPDEISNELAEQEGIKVIEVPISTSIAPLGDLVSIFRLIGVLLKFRPDVIHSHMSKAGLIGAIAGFIARVRVRIYHNHGMAFFSSSGARKLLLKTVERITCVLSNQIIFCSKSTMYIAIESGVCVRRKSRVLGEGTISGVSIEKYRPSLSQARRQELKRSIGIDEKAKYVVGFVGRVVAHKGIDDLMNSWASLPCDIREKTSLIIAGEVRGSPLESRFRSFVDASRNVLYLGRRNDIDKIYQIMDVLVLPSLHEGFPYSVLESQSVGVPAIVTEVPGNTDAILPGSTGLYVPVNDSGALSEAIEFLISHNSKRESMGIAARERVLGSFCEDVVMNNLTAFYDRLV